MTEIYYMISDVSRILDIPANVLRYLEYHLSLSIKRTELGHRYYLQEDIDLLRAVKVLRDKGFHLKIIKSILPYINQVKDLEEEKLNDLRDRLEAALGLSGIEAQERVKAQYGKAVDIDMEEGDFIIKDPATKQRTRLSSVKISTSEENTHSITKEVDGSREVHRLKDTIEPVEANLQSTADLQKEAEVKKQPNYETKRSTLKEVDNSREIKAFHEKEKVKEVNKYKRNDKMKKKEKSHETEKIQEMKKAKPIIEAKVQEREVGNRKELDELKDTSNQKEKCYNEEVAVAKIEIVKNINKTPRIVGVAKKGYKENGQMIQESEMKKEIELIQGRDKDSSLEQSSMQQKQLLERKSDNSLLKDSHDKIIQFREIMCSIVMDALSQNNHTLTNDINEVVTQSVVKEMDYMMKIREERQEERFRQLDRTIRETQLQRQQAAATKEGKKKRPSKFFQKHKVKI